MEFSQCCCLPPGGGGATGILTTDADEDRAAIEFYGQADLTKYDSDGNPVFTQTIHNQVVNTGEVFILNAVFDDGATDVADAAQIGSICVTSALTVSEAMTATSFDTANAITETNCKQATASVAGSVATIGPLTFKEGVSGNVATDDTIVGIGVCQGRTASDDDFNNCATAGILFSVIDTDDVTLGDGETVAITYTFTLASPNS